MGIDRGSCARGFTLLEMLVVTGVVASLAYLGVGLYQGVQERAEDNIARADLVQLAGALRQFRQDTGYYPGQGPFALSASATAESECAATDGILRGWAEPLVDAARDDWFASPANIAVLLVAPDICDLNPQSHLARWNSDTQRGWHGPYLSPGRRHWVDHGKDLNSSDGSGTPQAGEKLMDIPAYGNGPRFAAGGPEYGKCGNQSVTTGNCMLGWRRAPRYATDYDADVHEIALHPRPFLMFGLANGDAPRVVYSGLDGRYGGRNATDPCRANSTDDDGVDDVVICL